MVCLVCMIDVVSVKGEFMNKKQRGLLSVLVLTSITGMAFATDTDNLSIGGGTDR